MEKITKGEDSFYYGDRKCTADEAYRFFRKDYEATIGTDSYLKLRNLGKRTETVHWSGFCLDKDYYSKLSAEWSDSISVPSGIIGIVHTSYCRTINWDDCPELTDENYERFYDWLLEDGNRSLRLVNRKSGHGRTNKRKKVNFR